MTGFYQETAAAPGIWQCWGGSQNSPVGQVLLSETPSMEIWRAGAIPAVSLWLWWLGSSSKPGCCFFPSRKERGRRDRAEGERLWVQWQGCDEHPWLCQPPALTSSEAQVGRCICLTLPDSNRGILFNYLWLFWCLVSWYWQNKYCDLA